MRRANRTSPAAFQEEESNFLIALFAIASAATNGSTIRTAATVTGTAVRFAIAAL